MVPRLLAGLAAVAAALAGTHTSSAAPSYRSYTFNDRPVRLPAAFAPPGFNGGTYTATSTGESVRIFSAPDYATDTTFNQRWADFLATLPHGPEISTVTLYLAPLAQVGPVCGEHTLGCYSPENRTIFASAEDVPGRATAQSIVAHEYGHHIANSRRDTPWPAEDYGTKRWSSYENVCARSQAGTLFPGDEGDHYKLNSGEDFAETYRVYAEQKLGLAPSPWLAVDQSLYPNATALALLGEDIADPWTGPTVSNVTGSFKPYTGDARTVRFATSLDGVLTLTLHTTPGASFDVRLFDPSGRRLLGTTAFGARPVKIVRYLICGERSVLVRVVRTNGYGDFTLGISKP
jgi:hypothetical protein